MYPLAIILPVGILLKDKKIYYYVLPLSILGMVVAVYQYLLQLGIIPQGLLPCSLGVSCASPINWFGFVTIPLLSLLAFLGITVSVFIHLKSH